MMKGVLIVMVACTVVLVSGISCPPDYCGSVRCDPGVTRESCPAASAEYQPHGTFCGCCPVCIKLLDENAFCQTYLLGIPLSARCRDTLSCIDNKCSKI